MRRALAAAALALAMGAAGCGLGPGKSSGGVSERITRDFGQRALGYAQAARVPASETAMRFLQRHFSVTTRYGGGFVESIDGRSGSSARGGPLDWFYYVNGVEASAGAASTTLAAGDRVQWDLHDWGTTMRVPAIVGAFPEPFAHGTGGGKRAPVLLQCAPDAAAACESVSGQLLAAGVPASRSVLGTGTGQDTLRLLVGTWPQLRGDVAASQIERGPAASGVYARLDPSGRTLTLLGANGRTARRLGPGAGLIAATRFEAQEPTWVVTGTDAAGVQAAVSALDGPDLQGRFALAVAAGQKIPLPVAPG